MIYIFSYYAIVVIEKPALAEMYKVCVGNLLIVALVLFLLKDLVRDFNPIIFVHY